MIEHDRKTGPQVIPVTAEPSGIALTFCNPSFRDRIRLDSITCVLDAEQVFAAPELLQLKLWQIGFADLLILNKVDLVSRGHIAKIREWLDETFHRYRLIEAMHCDVPLEILLSVGRFDAAQLGTESHDHDESTCQDPHCHHRDHDHTRTFSTWSYETDQPLSLEALRETARKLPTTIYRAKGVIYTSDVPERRAVLQVVGKRVDLSLQDEWGVRTPATRIVVIGAAGGIDEAALRDRFDMVAVPNPALVRHEVASIAAIPSPKENRRV